MRVHWKSLSLMVCVMLMVGLALTGAVQAEAAHKGGRATQVAKARGLCKQASRVAPLGSRARRIGGICVVGGRELLGALASKHRVRHRRVIHTGKLVDTDTTYGDNVFNVAHGRAYCKHGERVVSGGLLIVSVSGLFGGPPRWEQGESVPFLKKPQGWSVALGSDLGGLARHDFRALVMCEK